MFPFHIITIEFNVEKLTIVHSAGNFSLSKAKQYKTIYNVFIYLFIYMEKDDLSKF